MLFHTFELMKMSRLTALWLLLVFVACEKPVLPDPGHGTDPPVSLGLSCQGAIVIDAASGTSLYAESPDYPLVPASMTKVMTMYIVFDHIEKGYLSLDSQIPVSPYAAGRSVNPGESNVPLNETLTYSVDEMIRALCVVSANACAVALGEYLSKGNERDFAVIIPRGRKRAVVAIIAVEMVKGANAHRGCAPKEVSDDLCHPRHFVVIIIPHLEVVPSLKEGEHAFRATVPV